MQAGREWEPGELDVLVAETLGWVFSERNETWSHNAIFKGELPKFSTTWDGMGVLVEEARKQGLGINIYSHVLGFYAEAFKAGEFGKGEYSPISDKAPHSACLAFLKAKGIAV